MGHTTIEKLFGGWSSSSVWYCSSLIESGPRRLQMNHFPPDSRKNSRGLNSLNLNLGGGCNSIRIASITIGTSITKTSIRVASIGQPPATTGAAGALTVSASTSITKTSIG